MANELLDFVMGLVRDPEAAARYAADPDQAIADAHLTDVASADVDNLIPMVSDSLSMAAPAFGAAAGVDELVDSNVWTSGAATSAFEAFDAFAPAVPGDTSAGVPDEGSVIDIGDVSAPEPVSDVVTGLEPVADSFLEQESMLLADVALDPQPWEEAADGPAPFGQGHTAFDPLD